MDNEQGDRGLNNQDKNLEIVFQYLDELLEKKETPQFERKRIGYKIGAGTK